MAHPRTPKPRRIRVGWVLAALAVLAVVFGGGSFAYQWQKERNTRQLLHDARQARQVGDLDRAIESYGLYLERTDADVDALRIYASLLYDRLTISRNWLGPGIRALRELHRIDPQDKQTVERLTRIYIELHEFALAEELGKKWVALAQDEPEAVLVLARASHGNNNNEQALKLLAEAASLNPQEPRYYPALVELLINVFQRHDDAREWVRRSLENAPLAFETHMAAFLFFENAGQLEPAQHHVERALELAPDTPEVLITAARFFIARGNLERVGWLLDRAAKHDPNAAGLLAARRAFAANSHDPGLLISVANDLQRAGETGDRALLAQAAELYLRAGALPQADSCIKSLESKHPATLPKGTLDSLRGARALMAGQSHAAIASLESAVRQQPSDLWTLELLARAFLRTGALDEASDLYRRMALLSPSAAAPRLALARLEIQNRNFDRAREVLASLKNPLPNEARQAKLLSILAGLNQPGDTNKSQWIEELEQLAVAQTQDSPTDIVAHEIMIHAFLDAGLPARAMETWRKSPGDSSTHDQIALDIGRRLIASGDFDSATRWTQELLAANPRSIEAKLLHCEILLTRQAFEDARQFVAETQATPEDQGLLWELLADKSPDPAHQVSAMTRAVQLRPSDIAVRQKLVRLLDDLPAAQKVIDEIRAIEGESGAQWRFERASLLLRLDSSPQAASTASNLLHECLDIRSGWVAAWALMGFVQERLGDLSDAVESYRAALALNPDLATHAVVFRLVDSLKQLGRYNEADVVLASMAKAMPDSIDVHRLLTEQHVRRQDLTSAAAIAEQILKLTPDDASWAAVTADLFLRAKDPARAEQTARKALTRHPDSLTVVTSLAQALLAQGKNEAAEQLVRQWAAEKKTASFDILLARVLAELRRVDEAVRVLENALMREPENAELHASVAEFWGAQGNRSRQLEFTRKTLQLQGEDPNQSLWLAAFLASGTGPQRDEASAIVRRRLTARPDDADALLLDAQLAVTAEPPDSDRAQTDLTAALKINPRSLNAHKMLAAVLIQKGEMNAADETIAAGLMAATDDLDLLVLSAEVRQHRGDFELSMAPLRRLIAAARPPLRAFDLLATAAIETHRIDQAIETIERLPDRPHEVTIVLARLYEANNNTDQAGALLRNVVEQAPSVGMPAYLLFQARRRDFDRVDDLTRTHAAKNPDDVSTQMTAAELLAAQAPSSILRQRGLESLERIAEQCPDRAADARFRAGLAYLQHGDLVNAETMLLNAYQLAPLSPKAVNALAWLYGEEMTDPQRGLAILARYEKSGGRASPEMLDTHGTLLFRAKRFDEATQRLNLCLRVSAFSANRTSALYHLALVQYETGASQDAAINLKAALQLNDRVGGLTHRQAEECRRLLHAGLSRR